MILTRRSLLLAAPAIVAAGSLMPISAWAWPASFSRYPLTFSAMYKLPGDIEWKTVHKLIAEGETFTLGDIYGLLPGNPSEFYLSSALLLPAH
jgi:hypothetical protein